MIKRLKTWLAEARESRGWLVGGAITAGERWTWRNEIEFWLMACGIFGLVCKARGHDLESDDFAGPDFGYMGAHCKRCGQSWGSYLY